MCWVLDKKKKVYNETLYHLFTDLIKPMIQLGEKYEVLQENSWTRSKKEKLA
jgi:hypothetical protein